MATSVSTFPVARVENPGWLRSASFDFHFIITLCLLSLACGSFALARPDLFVYILLLDVWLLGHHHNVSTLTRMVFDRESFRQNSFLVIQLPLIVAAATFGARWSLGAWILPTTYLYWQWFHYTRQSYGIERMYRRNADENAFIDDYVSTRTLYLVPIFGILYRSWQQPSYFLGMEVLTFHVPTYLVIATGVAALTATIIWIGQQVYAYSQGRLAPAHCLYVGSHLIIFATGYFLVENITAGWLVLNVWHNAQYIAFVWWFNNKRFKNQVDPKSRFLSTISQTKFVLIYLGVCLLISTIWFLSIQGVTKAIDQNSAISLTLTVAMVVNFHHYIVDGIIWKRKRAKTAAA